MNKITEKTSARQQKSTNKYEELVCYLKYKLSSQIKLRFSHAHYAEYLKCSTRTVRTLFQRLREDPRFHISQPKRQAKNKRFFYCLFVSLKMSLALLLSAGFLELESKDIYVISHTTICKSVATQDAQILKERLKKESLITNVHLLFPRKEDSQFVRSLKKTIKGERETYMSTVPPKDLPNLNKVVVGKAKRLWEEVSTKNKSQFYVKRELKRWLEDYPQGRQDLLMWFSSGEGRAMKEWLGSL